MKTCILAIQRYENIKDIEEWLDYHFNLGFGHIFLMDNNDEKDALQINKENLTILPAYDICVEIGDSTWQCDAYNTGLNYIRNLNEKYDWIAIIDIDEFIRLFTYRNINDFIINECINKNKDNIELKWRLFNDNELIYFKESYHGNIQNTFTQYFPINNMKYNDYDNFYDMQCFIKFIGKLKPELYFSTSPHYPAKELYDKGIYQWNLCDYNIGVIDHYKYKTLEDFIIGKCKCRNYVKSVHGSTWKYTRTYFEDNNISINKIFHFVMFDYKYKLNMEQWDIEYLHELIQKIFNKNDKKWIFDILLKKDININLLNEHIKNRNKYCNNFYLFYLNEKNLNLDICPYIKFMYNHKLYKLCEDFFKCLFIYYFGGICIDMNIKCIDYIDSYFENNDYILFENNNDFICSKPFNLLFKYFIDYCNKFTYKELENIYNSISKNDFINKFCNDNIISQIIKENNIHIKIIKNINKKIKYKENKLTLFDKSLLKNYKYTSNDYKQFIVYK